MRCDRGSGRRGLAADGARIEEELGDARRRLGAEASAVEEDGRALSFDAALWSLQSGFAESEQALIAVGSGGICGPFPKVFCFAPTGKVQIGPETAQSAK